MENKSTPAFQRRKDFIAPNFCMCIHSICVARKTKRRKICAGALVRKHEA